MIALKLIKKIIMDINKQIQESSKFNSTQIMVKTDKTEMEKDQTYFVAVVKTSYTFHDVL
jgi:hypothetical protein